MQRSVRTVTKIHETVDCQSFIASYRTHSGAFTRRRKLPFAIVVGAILKLAKKSLQIECNLLADQLMTEPASKQAFSQARYNISWSGFKALNTIALEQAYQGDATGLWNGFRVLGIDGSTARLPRSDELVDYFGVFEKVADRPEKCPVIARISEVVELTTGIVVSAELAPMCFGERRLAMEQIKEVYSLFQRLEQPPQLYVFDRGYASKEMMKTILEKEAHFLYRIPRKFSAKIDSAVCKGVLDGPIELDGLPTLRLIVRTLPSGEKCVLLTSLLTAEISGDEFYRLYWLRWTGCEEGYKRQKIRLELENFSGINLEAILQEFWATVTTLNVFLLECVDEEGPWDPEEPPDYRINRAVAFGSMRDSVLRTIVGEISAEELNEKFKRVAQQSKIKVKPGRQFSRDGVGKPKRHHVYRRTC